MHRYFFFSLCLPLFLLLIGCSDAPSEAIASTQSVAQDTMVTTVASTGSERISTPATALPTTQAVTEPVTEAPTMPETTAPTEPTVTLVENPAFLEAVGPCDGSILAALYNAPFVAGAPTPTVVWNEGEYDQLVIYPRYVDSIISAWRLTLSEDGTLIQQDAPVYTAACAEGDCYGAALDRPEGAAAWLIQVETPEGAVASLALSYNGRYGTPAFEFLIHPDSSPMSVSLPDIDNLEWLESVIGADPLYSILRAASRAGQQPWKAFSDYCSALADWGNIAAYTVFEGDMEGDTYHLSLGRLRESYDPKEGSLAQRLLDQDATYQEIGNEKGILKDGFEDGTPLYVDLKGITVYNPTLLAKSVAVSVNGEDRGVFPLTEGDFCTLIPLNVMELSAKEPVDVEVRVVESHGDMKATILEVWGALGGNISTAR